MFFRLNRFCVSTYAYPLLQHKIQSVATQRGHAPQSKVYDRARVRAFFIENHRRYLVNQKKPHRLYTEYQSDSVIEQDADSFAAGLLMPSYLLSPIINQIIEPTLEHVRETATLLDVSFTSLLVRWVQLSHFPCAAVCVRKNRIQWGFASETFKTAGLYRAKFGQTITGQDAGKFIATDPSFTRFRLGQGVGLAKNWLDWQGERIPVNEFYMVIPYSKNLMVFAVADEDDLPQRWNDWHTCGLVDNLSVYPSTRYQPPLTFDSG